MLDPWSLTNCYRDSFTFTSCTVRAIQGVEPISNQNYPSRHLLLYSKLPRVKDHICGMWFILRLSQYLDNVTSLCWLLDEWWIGNPRKEAVIVWAKHYPGSCLEGLKYCSRDHRCPGRHSNGVSPEIYCYSDVSENLTATIFCPEVDSSMALRNVGSGALHCAVSWARQEPTTDCIGSVERSQVDTWRQLKRKGFPVMSSFCERWNWIDSCTDRPRSLAGKYQVRISAGFQIIVRFRTTMFSPFKRMPGLGREVGHDLFPDIYIFSIRDSLIFQSRTMLCMLFGRSSARTAHKWNRKGYAERTEHRIQGKEGKTEIRTAYLWVDGRKSHN
jgi:hypothetical protein